MSNLLDSINSSNDVKKIPDRELPELCTELREFIIDNVSKTGGHLASNLGSVELTVALHRVYDTEQDRILFDVGHQCYTHKIITGRRDQFSTLRQINGISGFPKPYERVDDAFIAGHASNSISVALGMAKARTLSHENYDVAAVIGDGALSGGLAYEGLANAAVSGEPLVIILNDNNMSISKNVGGTNSLLHEMRVKSGYISFKRWYRSVFMHFPKLYRFNHRVKEWIKARLLPDNFFASMGLDYLGPVDGHDVNKLETVLRWAKEMRTTVLVHVLTQKGKGCDYAEKSPELYHGVGAFDPVTGELPPEKMSFAGSFGNSLCKFASTDKKIVAITAAMSSGTGLNGFAEQFQERFFDVGIAEGHAVSMASGMAKQGLTPVFAVYSSFLQRGYDMLIHDTALQKLHVVFGVDRAGIVGSDGETHQGVFDVNYLSSVPGMTVFCPASLHELHDMLYKALYRTDGPAAIRYPRGCEGAYRASHTENETILRAGTDVTLAAYGVMINEALAAAERLSEAGISAEVIKLGIIRPNSFEMTLSSVAKTGRLIVPEDVCETGCIGCQILAKVSVNGLKPKASKLINLGEGIVAHGSVSELLRAYSLDAVGIAAECIKLMND